MTVSTQEEPEVSSRKAVAAVAPAPAAAASAYDLSFWEAYVANTALVVANSLLFRYSDFVSFHGGTEFELGLIVGLGMVGSLCMRLAQGVGIDRYGARQIWLWSLALNFVTLLAHLLLTEVHGPAVYLLRIAYMTSVAGAFGASITAVSRRVPIERMAEIIGTLGTSGFLGMMLGPAIGDLISGGAPVKHHELVAMFATAAGLSLVSFVATWLATRKDARPLATRPAPPLLGLLRRYHPGAIMLAAAAMGFGLALPTVFLRPFAQSINLDRIAVFFAVYAPAAFAVRVLMRPMPERYGNRPLILVGFAALIGSVLAFLWVTQPWQLCLPAVLMGTSHALLFPTITAEGASAFPDRYRGLGTTVMLAMLDLGQLVGAPAVGGLLKAAEAARLPAYPTMFAAVALVLTSIVVLYAALSRKPNEAPVASVRR